MKYSQLFGKTRLTPPKEADTVNHKLLTQAGFVNQLMAGVYSYLPLGLRVLNKIETIVREEMNAIGSNEILMPVLHPKENWEITGGWNSIDVLFKIQSRTKREYALGQSEEEVVTPLVRDFIHSYKDLPMSVYQIHWKYRDELRAKSGILRGREFFMKDMYSFHETQEDFERYYEIVKQAYKKIFERMGLTAKVTEASGGSFSKKISYEFMILTDAGEDDILYCESCDYCVNQQIAQVKSGDVCPKCGRSKLKEARAAEAGNVFDLGKKYGQDFGFSFTDKEGGRQTPVMGCYGIGISRAMGILVETFHDDRGIIWPEAVAPYQAHLISLNSKFQISNDKQNINRAEEIYSKLQEAGIEVLWDDRDESPGVKFADADLIGLPVRLVVSARNGEMIEWKRRNEQESQLISMEEVLRRLSSK